MRLISIKLAGFKSFVDPTTVYFPSNLIAVVGPNGSGKSNIIDAVRWVMGESSAKYLRGESMSDVIFNGSTSRKPVGQASIELLFDNSEGKLGGEYAKYTQISVKRIVTRDGQSTYLLNGSRCRRRDVTDLFLGTGLGPRSYAIIMQDTISRLIEAKPEELRIYLEEAAGISKYKERRKETESRISHTRENLARLTDLRDELGKQLNHLHRQAKAAEKYKELKEEHRLVRAHLSAFRWRSFSQQATEIAQIIRQSEIKVESSIARLRSIDAEFEHQHEIQIEVTEAFNQVQSNYYGLAAEIARFEQTKQHQLERQQQLKTDLINTENSVAQFQQELAQDEKQLNVLQTSIEDLSPKVELAVETSEASQEALSEIEFTLQQWQNQWDVFNEQTAKSLQQAEVAQTQIQHVEQRQQETQRRLENLIQEKNNINTAKVADELQQLEQESSSLKQQQEEQQTNLDNTQEEIVQYQHLQTKLNNELHQQQSLLQQSQGKLASLEALQQAALGQKNHAAMDWLSQQNLANKSRLAQILKVESGWEHAVETVLSDLLEAVCLEDIAKAAENINQLTQGNISFIKDTDASVTESTLKSTLASKISGNEAVVALLTHIYIAESSAEAMTLAKTLKSYESVITKSGHWYGNGWLKIQQSKDEKTGVLQRQQELLQLEQKILESKNEVSQLQQQLNNTYEKLQELEEQRTQSQQLLRQTIAQINQIQAKQHVKQAELKQMDVRLQQLSENINEQQTLSAELITQLNQARSEWHQALASKELNTNKREELLMLRDDYRNQLDLAKQRTRENKDKAHQLALELQAAKTQFNALGQAKQRVQAQLSQMQERCSAIATMLEEIVEPLNRVSEQLSQNLASQLVLEKDLNSARQKVEIVEQKTRALAKDRQLVETEIEEMREQLNAAKMQAQTLKVKQDTLEEQVKEMQFDLETLLQEAPSEGSENESEQLLLQLDQKISRLGPINLAAIDEYESVSERKTYLDSQDADLVDALNTLENAIRKIDRETRERFKETYDKVNEHFQHLFPKIFGGGSAYLELTGDDLLETGVSVMARPPGKRNSTIHLLSGGEKALTAMALVFSLFQLNPAPFCMLDEVDAPLDDTNVGRFCSLVKEMAKTVQFIFISHNKLAIEMADHLTGVTMREPGVSRLVAVDVKEAVELARV